MLPRRSAPRFLSHMFDSVQSQTLIQESLDSVERWVEAHNYCGYEPFDGLSSWFRPLTFGTLLGDRLLLQLIRQSPINLRPLMGVKAKESTKGRGYMASGYAVRYRITGNKEYLEKAEACLDWLDRHKVSRFQNHSWSNHFDFSSRGGSYTKDDPIIVWTSLIGQAFLDVFEITRENRWLEIADSVCRWIMDLPRERTSQGDCLSYLPGIQSSIHNANMLGGAMLARTARHTGNERYLQVSQSAMEYSCSRQRADGSWWYAENPKYQWIDNFHTGYNLDSLRCYIENTGDETWNVNLAKGLAYYKDNFFESDGCPKYYHNRRYPVDSQCAAQSIDTLATFSSEDVDCLALAIKVAAWTIQKMQDKDGHFYYRIYPLMKARTPMLHWAQATMYKSLAVLAAHLQEDISTRAKSSTKYLNPEGVIG
jgi:rhamnogalacturonyl hydrolase YesR